MKTTFIKLLAIFSIAFGFTGCVEDDLKMDTPDTTLKTYEMTATRSIASLALQYQNTFTPTLITADDVIEAYVTSSDETGTFYTTISFQNIPNNTSQPIGFSVSADFTSYIEGYTPGRKAYIKLKGLYIAKVDGSLKIGALYQGGIGRISAGEWQNHLFPSATVVPENDMVRNISLAAAAADANLNTLVELQNVQFFDGSLNRTFYDIDSGGSATNHNIVDVNGGTTRFFRVSAYALFASLNVPSGTGSIRGVMTKFGSDYQFLVRHQNDVKLNNPRSYTFNSSLSENFDSNLGQMALRNYFNFATEGTKYWSVKSVNSPNNIISLSMSSFGGALERNKAYFAIPVNMTNASTFSFQVDSDFYTGGFGLKVYQSMNFDPTKPLSQATLSDISGNFTVPTNQTTALLPAGTYNIPAGLTGNGWFIFEYTGSNLIGLNLLTTNCNIDNIVIN